MPGWIGEHVERFALILGTVIEQSGTQVFGMLAMTLKSLHGGAWSWSWSWSFGTVMWSAYLSTQQPTERFGSAGSGRDPNERSEEPGLDRPSRPSHSRLLAVRALGFAARRPAARASSGWSPQEASLPRLCLDAPAGAVPWTGD